MTTLIIAEKPSVAADIAKTLEVKNRQNGYIEGNGYIITWCFGHLIGLVDASEYNEAYKKWNLSDLPIIPDNFKLKVNSLLFYFLT